jgi:hypothetical protein
VSSFVEDYINAIKELTEKMLAQLSIPQTFVNGLFPKYMTSKGAYVKIFISKNEMQAAILITKLLRSSTLDIDVELVEESIPKLFALKSTANIIPFFYVSEPFCRVERIILVTERCFNEYQKLLENVSYSTIFKGIGINALVHLEQGGDVKLIDVCADAGMLPLRVNDAIVRIPFLWFISYPIDKLRTNVAKYHALYEVSEYIHRLFARPTPRALEAILYQFSNTVKNEEYEKSLHNFLCRYPWFIEPGTIYATCNEYLGRYRPDMVLFLFDGTVAIVELEPSKVKLFTRQGSISSEFEKRLKQIRDYIMYYREHRELFNRFVGEGILRTTPDINEIRGILIIASSLTNEELKELSKVKSLYEKEGIRILTYDELIAKISFTLKYISGEMFRSYGHVFSTSDTFEIRKSIVLRSFVSLIGGLTI